MAVNTYSGTVFKQYKNKRNRCLEGMGKLENILKSHFKKIQKKCRRNRRKYLKIREDQIKQLIVAKKTSYSKWFASKKLEDTIEYKRNTVLAKTEARRRHRATWDKFYKFRAQDTYDPT